MKFQNYLVFMIVIVWIPFLIYFIAASKRSRNSFLKQFSRTQINGVVAISERRLWVKRILLFSALSFLTIAAARPQMGESEINLQSEGIDIAVIFDISLSMLAEDENGSRFEKGKELLIDAVSELKGDRVALIPFAGSAFLQLPLTADYNTALSIINELRPGMIENQGTSFGAAFELAVETLKSGEQNSDRLIIVVSDGEDPRLDFNEVKKMLNENKINLAVMPLGSADGAPIKFGESYLKDDAGNTVITKLQKDFFEKSISGLGAQEIKKSGTIDSFLKGFKNKVKRGEKRIHFFEERFQIPLFIAIVLFMAFIFLPSGRKD